MWSPELDTGVCTVQHWEARRNNIDDSTKTKRVVRIPAELGITDDTNKSKQVIRSELKQAYSGLRRTQLKHQEKRIEFLNGLADKYAASNNISKDLAIRELLLHEEIRKIFRKIRIRMKGSNSPQMSEVWKKMLKARK